MVRTMSSEFSFLGIVITRRAASGNAGGNLFGKLASEGTTPNLFAESGASAATATPATNLFGAFKKPDAPAPAAEAPSTTAEGATSTAPKNLFGGFGGFNDPWGVDRRGFAPVSQRAHAAREQVSDPRKHTSHALFTRL